MNYLDDLENGKDAVAIILQMQEEIDVLKDVNIRGQKKICDQARELKILRKLRKENLKTR